MTPETHKRLQSLRKNLKKNTESEEVQINELRATEHPEDGIQMVLETLQRKESKTLKVKTAYLVQSFADFLSFSRIAQGCFCPAIKQQCGRDPHVCDSVACPLSSGHGSLRTKWAVSTS